MTLTCEEVQKKVKAHAVDLLEVEVNKREDMFLDGVSDYDSEGRRIDYKELNSYAIAEWAYHLLERQRTAILEAVERAFDECSDNDNDNEEQA